MIDFDLCMKYIDYFTDQEDRLLGFRIFSFVVDEMEKRKKDVDYEFKDDVTYIESYEETRENIIKLVEMFHKFSASISQQTFVENFPVWSPLRLETVKQIIDLANDINRVTRNCNISTITSCTIGLLGGAALIGSLTAVFPPAALGIAGGTATGIGTFMGFGTRISKFFLVKKRKKIVEDIIDEDSAAFISVQDVFQTGREILVLFKNTLHENYLFYHDMTFVEEILNVYSDSEELANQNRDGIHSRLKSLILLFIDKLHDYNMRFKFDFLIPTIVTFCFVMIVLKKRNNKIITSIIRAANERKTSVFSHFSSESFEEVFMSSGDLFMPIIGMIKNTIDLALALIDIHRGSINPAAEELESNALKLDLEHTFLESIFNDLQCKKWGKQ